MNNMLLAILKFVLIALLLPVTWAASVTFHQHVITLPGTYGDFFFWGMFGFVLVFLFFYQFWGVYEFGQKLVFGTFQFIAPVNDVIAKIIPFYLTLILLLFHTTKNFLNVDTFDPYFMFFAGFSFTMHIILTAQELQQQEKMLFKLEYLFEMTFVIILVIFVSVLLVDLVIGDFTFLSFFEVLWNKALDIYYIGGKNIFFLT